MKLIAIQWRIQDFPGEGAPTPKGGAPTYYLANFSRKLHENKEIWGHRGGARLSRPPLRSPTAIFMQYSSYVLVGGLCYCGYSDKNELPSYLQLFELFVKFSHTIVVVSFSKTGKVQGVWTLLKLQTVEVPGLSP